VAIILPDEVVCSTARRSVWASAWQNHHLAVQSKLYSLKIQWVHWNGKIASVLAARARQGRLEDLRCDGVNDNRLPVVRASTPLDDNVVAGEVWTWPLGFPVGTKDPSAFLDPS
jgi:hypothetical protein